MSSGKSTAYRVELTHRASEDLDSIYRFIDAESCTAAWTWFNELEELIFSLDRLPNRGSRPPEDRSLRQLLHGNKPHVYRLIDSVDEPTRTVHVLHIRHGARMSSSHGFALI
jgi:plasmid stabilization system protein ParE